MFNQLPSNATTWLIGFPVFAFFGIRAWQNYLKLHNPLSRYFAYSGFMAATAFFFYSVPFFFTTDYTILMICNIIGDFFLFFMFFLQAKLIYYVSLKNKVSEKVIILPVAVIAIVGFLGNCYGYLKNGVSIVDNKFEYSLPLISDVCQTVLLVVVLLVGILLSTRIPQQPSMRSKVTLLGISMLYILSSIAGALNVLLSGSPNESPIIILSYIVGFFGFVIILFSSRIFKRK